MDILKLRSFVMVARLGHLTRAAERLFLTQPAVTAHIKAIEQELGIALFDRAPGRISLTRQGELLLPEAEHVLAVFEGFTAKARQVKGEVVLWPHGRIESRLSFIYRLSAEHDPAIVGMLSVLREQWGV